MTDGAPLDEGDSVGGQRIAVARAYVDALVSHDPSGVRLHPDCTRVEMGIKTGRSGDHIARSLARGPQFRLIHRVSGFEASSINVVSVDGTNSGFVPSSRVSDVRVDAE